MIIEFPDGKPWFMKPGRPNKNDFVRNSISAEFSAHLMRLYQGGATFQCLADRYCVHIRTVWNRVQNAIDAEELKL